MHDKRLRHNTQHEQVKTWMHNSSHNLTCKSTQVQQANMTKLSLKLNMNAPQIAKCLVSKLQTESNFWHDESSHSDCNFSHSREEVVSVHKRSKCFFYTWTGLVIFLDLWGRPTGSIGVADELEGATMDFHHLPSRLTGRIGRALRRHCGRWKVCPGWNRRDKQSLTLFTIPGICWTRSGLYSALPRSNANSLAIWGARL